MAITLMEWSQYQIAPGDTSRFITNFNGYLIGLEQLVTQINDEATSLNELAGEMRAARDSTVGAAGVVAGNVFDDAQVSTLTGWTSQKLNTELQDKVDTSQVLTDVPEDAVFTDTLYTHPESHEATEINQDADHRFVTDTEKAQWGSAKNAHFEQKYFGGM